VLFADDFDTSQALPRNWDFETTSDGTPALDSSNSFSPPTSLRASAGALPAGAPGNAADVTLRKQVQMPGPGQTVEYDFEAFVSQVDQSNGANAVIGALQIGDPAGDLYEMQIDATPTTSGALSIIFAEYTGFADAASSYTAHPVATTFPIGEWTAVRVEFTQSSPPSASLYFGGKLVLQTTVNVPIQGNFMQLCAGLSYVSAPSDAWTVNYDNAEYVTP
jgi:hypothetical protein